MSSKQKIHLDKLNQYKRQVSFEKNKHIANTVHEKRLEDSSMSIKQISDEIGISYFKTYKAYKQFYPDFVSTKDNGKKVYGKNAPGHDKRQSIPDEDVNTVANLYLEELLTMRQIGEVYDCTAGAVLNYFKKHNINRRSISEASKLVWTDEMRHQASIRSTNAYVNQRKVETEPEREFIRWLQVNDVMFIPQFRKTGINHPYDFLLPEFNLLVEIDGTYWHSLPNQKLKDKDQVVHAINAGYNIVRIDATEAKKVGYDYSRWIMKGDTWNVI